MIRNRAKQQLVLATHLPQPRVREICDVVAPTCKSLGSYSLALEREDRLTEGDGYFRLSTKYGAPGRIVRMLSFLVFIMRGDDARNPRRDEDDPGLTVLATEVQRFLTVKSKMGGMIPMGPEKITAGFRSYVRFTNGVSAAIRGEDPGIQVRLLPQ